MTDIRIVGRPGSKSVSTIVKKTGLKRYSHTCDIVVNYGLAGIKYSTFIKKHPSADKKDFINRWIGCSKLKAIKDAENNDILVPKTFESLSLKYKSSDFLIKRMHSQGGVGIYKAKTKARRVGEYYQEFIKDRKYELRIHAFSWLSENEWAVQKRLGDKDVIAWNFHNGGKFQTVHNPDKYNIFKEARKVSAKVLKIRGMQFGAIDFIVTQKEQLYFLEINSAPGFTELSEPIYINAFSKLIKLSKKELNNLTR